MKHLILMLISISILMITSLTGCSQHKAFEKPNFCIPCQTMSIESAYGIDECSTAYKLQNRSQVKEFMLWDNTSDNKYTDHYQCNNFVRNVIRNAELNSIDAGFVIISLSNSTELHSIIVFPTIDDGNIFVDATQGDWWVSITPDGKYFSYSITDSNVHSFWNETLEYFHIIE